MSIQHCFNCDTDIDTDTNAEHFEMCKDPAAVSLGKKGGDATHKKHPNHLKEISKLGVEARKKKLTEQYAVKKEGGER